MDIAEFNSAFADARHRQRTESDFDVAAAQHELRTLVSDEPDGEDRAWALRLIDKLAEPLPPPRQWSALYHEAGAIHAGTYRTGDSVEERIAAIQEARRRIWAIADRAPRDEAPHIRAMTRVLDHIEAELREPSFTQDDTTRQGD
ncbi:hypothetical protein AB0E63_13520 [Kribbella sp. NPDC026596]|uniref:hypothetical protein n=1 Tax=Kribbella sp. NPDC026596 TaxID=3155122 RepID=UPI0033FCCC55